MKLDSEKIRELHAIAVEDIQEALQKQDRWASSGGARKIGYTPSAELVAAVGETEAERLQYRAVSDLGDLLHNRDEFVQTAESAKRSLDEAIVGAKGGRGRLNSLGVLQNTGPRIDVLAATFSLRVDAAISAWHGVLCAVEEARAEDPEGLKKAAEAVETQRALDRKASQKAAREREEARKEKESKECQAHTQGGTWKGGTKCTKKAKTVAVLEDGTTFRFCGTHLNSAVYGRYASLEVGNHIHVGGTRKKVVALEDFIA
jgi:hypothetical protein